ncbi:MAG: glutaredoxin family protein [Verrucomicrobiae bacterium]|nr:glutaredoxin family protein [Verrucomicrobiae bacterium]
MKSPTCEVVIYTVPGCWVCRQARQWLIKQQVQFREVNVLVKPRAVAAFVNLWSPMFPVIVVGDKFMIGFSEPELSRLLKSTLR